MSRVVVLKTELMVGKGMGHDCPKADRRLVTRYWTEGDSVSGLAYLRWYHCAICDTTYVGLLKAVGLSNLEDRLRLLFHAMRDSPRAGAIIAAIDALIAESGVLSEERSGDAQ